MKKISPVLLFLIFVLLQKDLFSQKTKAKAKSETTKQAKPVVEHNSIIEIPSEEELEYNNSFGDNKKRFIRTYAADNNSYSGLFGINDSSGNVILPCVFSGIKKSGNYYIANISGTYSLFDKDFKLLFPPEFQYLERTNTGNLFITSGKYSQWNKFSVIDENKNIIVPPLYKSIRKFYYQPQTFYVNYKPVDKYITVINEQGAIAFYDTDKRKFATDFSFSDVALEGWCFIALLPKSKCQLLDFDLRPLSYEPFDKAKKIGNDGFILVEKNKKKGIIFNGGKYLLPLEYDEISTMQYGGINYFLTAENGQYKLIDKDGKVTFDYGICQSVKPSYENQKIIVKRNNQMGVLNSHGGEEVPVKYDTLFEDFHFYFGKKMGGYDIYKKNGKLVKTIFYDSLAPMFNGYLVAKNNKRGVLNEIFEEVAPPDLDTALYYPLMKKTAFMIKRGNKWGIINDKKEIILPVAYELISHIGQEHLLLKQNNKYGLYSLKNEAVQVDCIYDIIALKGYEKGSFICIKGSESVVIE